MKNDFDDQNHSLPEEADEVGKCDEVAGTTLNFSQSTSNSPENDDILDEEEHLCEEFSSLMGKEFEISMMGELTFFLGLQIKQSSNEISICQEKYIKEMLKKFNMFDSKPIDTPMGTNSKMIVEESDPLVNQTMYRGIIGSLLYLTASRTHIVYSVGMCVRFQACPRDSHLKAAKHILRYLKKTGDLGSLLSCR